MMVMEKGPAAEGAKAAAPAKAQRRIRNQQRSNQQFAE